MGSKKKRNRIKQPDKIDNSLCRMGEEYKKKLGAENVELRFKTKNKLSLAIINVVQPLLDHATSIAEDRLDLTLGVMAWTLSLLDDERAIDETLEAHKEAFKIGTIPWSEIKCLIQYLIERKLALYPDDRRMIQDYQIVDKNEKYQFNVLSTEMNLSGKNKI